MIGEEVNFFFLKLKHIEAKICKHDNKHKTNGNSFMLMSKAANSLSADDH